MAIDVQFRKNTLFVNKKPINFDFEIGNAFTVDDRIVFMLQIPQNDDTLQNIYCLNVDGQFLWQVQSVLEAYPELREEIPFVHIALREDGTLTASDFFGRNFDIDSVTGQITNFRIAR